MRLDCSACAHKYDIKATFDAWQEKTFIGMVVLDQWNLAGSIGMRHIQIVHALLSFGWTVSSSAPPVRLDSLGTSNIWKIDRTAD
jgi:hypothetical protein